MEVDPQTTLPSILSAYVLSKEIFKDSEELRKSFFNFLSYHLFGKRIIRSKAQLKAKIKIETKLINIRGEEEIRKAELISKMNILELERNHENLQNVLNKTIPHLNPDITYETFSGFDNDKIVKILTLAKEISNEDMQELIAQILAGEYNSPNKYSTFTVMTLAFMSRKELELFRSFSRLILDGSFLLHDFFNLENEAVSLREVTGYKYDDLILLQDIGLFANNTVNTSYEASPKGIVIVEYLTRKLTLEFAGNKIATNKLPLSIAGKELYPLLIDDQPIESYWEWVKKYYSTKGFIITKEE